MARFEPFRGIRFDPDRVDLAQVTAPPYDVIDTDQRNALAARSPHNIVRIDVPVEPDDYALAKSNLDTWLADGVLIEDDEPSFYVYRMGFKDEAGRAHQTSGIIGALELMKPGTGDVLPHEQTTPKAKTDRLELLRATHANLSPIWGLSMAPGVGAFAELPLQPIARWTDDDAVHHRLYRITEPGTVQAVTDAIGSAPVVIADGHHRYETSLAYRSEVRQANGDQPGGHDLTLAFVVELAADQLFVQAIHRLYRDLDPAIDLVEVLSDHFEPIEGGPLTSTITRQMADTGALALARPNQDVVLLRPRMERFEGVEDLDSARIAHAMSAVSHEVSYQHGVDNVARALDRGDAQAAVLLRPVPVPVIMSTAQARGLMPPKSTFFAPKPRTGLVLRKL